jgi:hypothetical protein
MCQTCRCTHFVPIPALKIGLAAGIDSAPQLLEL